MDRRQQFLDKILEQNELKGQNSILLTKVHYQEIISRLEVLKLPGVNFNKVDYNLIRRYQLLEVEVNNELVSFLVKPNTKLRFASVEDIYDVLNDFHLLSGASSRGHGGRDIIAEKLKDLYANMTREHIMAYLDLCEICHKK